MLPSGRSRSSPPTDVRPPRSAKVSRGKKEAQLQLADGTPLSAWLTSPKEFDAAAAAALREHSRDAIRVQVEEAL
jgi:hypothetical protein